MAILTISCGKCECDECRNKREMTHYEYMKMIYPSMTEEEYKKWIQSGIRQARVDCFKSNYCISQEKLMRRAELLVSDMVHRLIDYEKVLRSQNLR